MSKVKPILIYLGRGHKCFTGFSCNFKSLEKVHNLKGDLQKLALDFESKKQRVIGKDDDLRVKFEGLEKEEQEIKKFYQRGEEDNKTKWNIDLEEIAQENQNIEEAWRDLNENEEQVTAALEEEDLNDEERGQLLQKQDELEQARALLKLEEDNLSKREKQLIDDIELQMEDFESRKKAALEEIRTRKDKMLTEADKELSKLNKVILGQEAEISALESDIETHDQDILSLNGKLKNLSDTNTAEIEKITRKRNSLVLESENFEGEIEKTTTQLNSQVDEIQANLQKELAKLQQEREK